MKRGFQLTLSTVIVLVILLVTLLAILFYFKTGFQSAGGAVTYFGQQVGTETAGKILPGFGIGAQGSMFHFFCPAECKCDYKCVSASWELQCDHGTCTGDCGCGRCPASPDAALCT